jgi:hypothetical protein
MVLGSGFPDAGYLFASHEKCSLANKADKKQVYSRKTLKNKDLSEALFSSPQLPSGSRM